MMRILEGHKVNECNRAIVLTAGEPCAGGADKVYIAEHANPDGSGRGFCQRIEFHSGPVADGVNGVTHEVLLAVLMDRLERFQNGPYACDENDTALFHLRAAAGVLAGRTYRRTVEGKEGTHTV